MKDEKGLVEVTMLVERGGALAPTRAYDHEGRRFVEGVDGARYAIRVKNLSTTRVEVVTSVDGLDVGTGEEAATKLRGHVIEANASWDFEGYRLSLDEVATFRFGGVASSYAVKMGKPRNVGVIGVAVFEEKALPAPPPRAPMPPIMHTPNIGESRTRSGVLPSDGGDMQTRSGMFHAPPPPAPPSMQTGAPAPPNDPAPRALGTEFGERRANKIKTVSFDRATTAPAGVVSFRYEHREALVALGIAVDDRAEPADRASADPFPGDRTFAKPPPGWTG